VPLATAVGAYVRLSTQLLPTLTDPHVKLPGPLHPAGNVPKDPEMPNPVTSRASLDVKVMLTVRLEPTTTATSTLEGVATTPSFVPASVAPPLNPEVTVSEPPTPGVVVVVAGGGGGTIALL
jgi:hypothetical protein